MTGPLAPLPRLAVEPVLVLGPIQSWQPMSVSNDWISIPKEDILSLESMEAY